MHPLTIMAQTTEAPGGIAALGLNLKYFLFQLVSFVIVLLVLRKWVFPKLVQTLEDRRKVVEQSLERAKATEEAMRDAKKEITALLHEARSEAKAMVEISRKEAIAFMNEAEEKANKKAQYILKEAKTQVDADYLAAANKLKQETAQLVAAATEQIIKQKVDVSKDAELIKTALGQVTEGKH
ncbi:MAG TPA: F0F1 ATP synthase subunit B [Patescibacteria group bacterium]|jgi:F-type H+-transporting ATPase subunit b|nr:F0F1 ATP synthase subunit B [Patescibacteria group bacterium]